MEHRYDEFSLAIRWRQPNAGYWPRPEVPGFYITLGWANEGDADFPLRDYPLSFSDVTEIVAAIQDTTGEMFPVDLQKNRYEADKARSLKALKDQRDKLDGAISKLERF